MVCAFEEDRRAHVVPGNDNDNSQPATRIMIIEAFTQTYTRLRYLKVAVTSIPDFKPDGKPAAHVTTLADSAKLGLEVALTQKVTAATTRGQLETLWDTAHDQSVVVHACMKSCYRHDRASLDSIRAVPTDDKTAAQTLHRMKELSAVWAALPSLPGSGELFAVRGVTKASFDTLLDGLDDKITESTQESVLLDNEEAKLRVLNSQVEDFITAALVQGRVQYPAGTPERAFIEAVPTDPSTQKPGQAEITQATSPAEGEAHLEFDAAHATSFQVWYKAPGEAQFVQAGDSIRPGNYSVVGLAAGNHEYQIVGVNSRGEGPASATATVSVAVIAVAAA